MAYGADCRVKIADIVNSLLKAQGTCTEARPRGRLLFSAFKHFYRVKIGPFLAEILPEM